MQKSLSTPFPILSGGVQKGRITVDLFELPLHLWSGFREFLEFGFSQTFTNLAKANA